MSKRSSVLGLTVDAYLATLRQLDRLESATWTTISPLAARLRAGRERDEWSSRLARAERVAGSLSPAERRALEDGGWSQLVRSLAPSGLSAEEVEQFVAEFAEAVRLAERYRQAGLCGRLQALFSSDPLLSRLRGSRTSNRG